MDWNRLEQLLEEASALPEERRETFLRDACGTDGDLLAEALALAKHVEPGRDYFSDLAEKVTAAPDAEGYQPYDLIGPYKLLELLGEGGMGQVWLAEQREPVRRRVALKVIKLGMDTREVVARFESERQALAVMDHPGIARVFDGGMTGSGRPYFVMEVVKGVPITEYCDTHRLTTRERIRLFIRVCEAVQHAHLKGVIHRDLKPSNVLVAVHDTEPHPKVIDFGVAKAVTGTLTDATLVTSLGQMVGTPAYMSPEQAEQSGLDIDSRTDVYALGVMLYELLSGALPFDADTLRKPAHVLQYVLRDKAVPAPSTRLGALSDTQQTVASARSTDVRTLQRELKGDLDWIAMKAMDKDRTRRYETASGLSEDLRRYLAFEPVLARPPSAGYRLRRLVRRNRGTVLGAAATVAALLVGMVGTTVGLVRATRAEAVAREEAATSDAVSDFLASLFATQSPSQTLGRELTATEILDLGAERVRDELADQPLVQARVLESIGDVYNRLGRNEEALPLLEESLAIRERVAGPESLEAASSILVLVRMLPDVGRREVLLNRALATFEREEGEVSIGAIRARQNLSSVYQSTGRFDEAEAMLLEAERAVGLLPPGVPVPEVEYQTPRALLGRFKGFRAALYGAQGRWSDELQLREEAVRLLEGSVDPDNPYLANAYRDLARRYRTMERNHEAVEIQERAVASTELVFGQKSRQVADALVTLAIIRTDLGAFDEAEADLVRARAIREALDGPEALTAAEVTLNLGNVELARGRPQRAEELYVEILPVYTATEAVGLDYLYNRLASALEHQGRLDEAAQWASRAVAAAHERYGWAHLQSEAQRGKLALLHVAAGRPDSGGRVHVEASDTIEALFGVESLQFGRQARLVAEFYRDQGDERAAGWVERSVRTLAGVGASFDEISRALRAQVSIYERAGRFDEAIQAQEEVVALVEGEGVERRFDLVIDLVRFRGLYERAGRAEEANPSQERAYEVLRAYLEGVVDTTRAQFAYLGGTAQWVGDFETARHAFERQLDFVSLGLASSLRNTLMIRTGLEEIHLELGDTAARLANFEAALEEYDGADPQRRQVLLSTDVSRQPFEDFLRRYEDLLRGLGRAADADAVARRIEDLRDAGPPDGEERSRPQGGARGSGRV